MLGGDFDFDVFAVGGDDLGGAKDGLFEGEDDSGAVVGAASGATGAAEAKDGA